ncbi:MAG TPA: hypothetical protein VKT82_01800 [Ktedonobacterales bacterium]|nr:hypothetical protein [Ktedonobacterales bacterium]
MRLVLLIFPARRQVEVWQPGEVVGLLGLAGELDGRDVIPGFQVSVRSVITGTRPA